MADGIIAEIKHQLITGNTSILNGTIDALMEDTVYTMESTSAVMGGPTTPIGPMKWTIAKPRIDVR